MAHQPAGVKIQNENTGVHQKNIGVHQNENAGVIQNANTHSPHSRHHDTQNDHTIKMENTIDETGNENEDENDAGNEGKNGHEAPNKNKNEQGDLEEGSTNNNETDPDTNKNVTDPDTMSDTMDKQYSERTRTNRRASKRKSDLNPKLRIHPIINSKQSTVLHNNAMVQTMGNTHLDLIDYARLNSTIHCRPNRHDNMMRNPLVTTIPTEYHVSKGLKVFGEPGVAAVLK